MKLPVVSAAVSRVRRGVYGTLLRVQSWWWRGEVRAVSVLCRDCGFWVAAKRWNPALRLCASCVVSAQDRHRVGQAAGWAGVR